MIQKVYLLFLLLIPRLAIAIDLDGNGLADVWELRFGAVGLVAEGDPDGDGFSNLLEERSGTDPLLASDFPKDTSVQISGPPVQEFSFFGHAGQYYTVLSSSSMDNFLPIARPFLGRGEEVRIKVGSPGKLHVPASVHHCLWANIPSGSELSALTSLTSFPDEPDGEEEILALARPSYRANGFGGTMVVALQAKVSGIHRFSLSSSGPSELLMKTAGQAGDPFKIAEVLSGQSDLLPGDWDRYPGQTSLTFSFVAGESYELEVRYLATQRNGHCEVAVTPPGASEPERVTSSDFAPRIIDLPAGQNTDRLFFKVFRNQDDQDGDGLSDWEERQLAFNRHFLFFDPQTLPGVPDQNSFSTLGVNNPSTVEVSLSTKKATAYERHSPLPGSGHGELLLTRTNTFGGLRLNIESLPLPVSEFGQVAEAGEYVIIDLSSGQTIDTQVVFSIFESSKILQIVAIPDSQNEVPEALTLRVVESPRFVLDEESNEGSIQLIDFPDHPDNDALFIGRFTGFPGIESRGTGTAALVLNGPRTEARISSAFSGFESVQMGTQVRRSTQFSGSPLQPGSLVYRATEVPGDAESTPVTGPLDDYPWDFSAAEDPQSFLDSLFGQDGESPLYLELQTGNHPSGEAWAILSQSGGSQNDPGPPILAAAPGSADFPQLFGDDLESEVRRFLNQATFGATDEEVAALLNSINSERVSDPSYHRVAAFDDWMTDQIALPQSYHVDYAFAADWQRYEIAGTFDPVRNPSRDDLVYPDLVTPARPSVWPWVDRSHPSPEKWHLSHPYPLGREDLHMLNSNLLRSEPDDRSERQVLWQMMINSRDQFRQKMGFSLQQILVASYTSLSLRRQPYGMANYQDLLNDGAFGSYRNLLGRANYSPIIGRWLSSIQNQKEADLDGDGFPDVFPDENLARENMQLFSIGLFELWSDGSVRLDPSGVPIPTYNNDDISSFAKILTGLSFGKFNDDRARWGGVPYEEMPDNEIFNRPIVSRGLLSKRYFYPMIFFGDFHDQSVKKFAGTIIDNTHLASLPDKQAVADLEDALDWLAGSPGDGLPDFDMVNSHRSTPAFISRLLIQRLVTSNPTREYLHRVATTFATNEGDLGKTFRSILLDPAARNIDLSDKEFGMKKSSIESHVQVIRALGATTRIPLTLPESPSLYDSAPGNFSDPNLYLSSFNYPHAQMMNQTRNFRFLQMNGMAVISPVRGLQMNPMTQPSVFNWYSPNYSPGGKLSRAGLVAPELQLVTESDVIRNINYLAQLALLERGLLADSLGGAIANQRFIFGDVADSEVTDMNSWIRLEIRRLGENLYPSEMPSPTNDRDSLSLADEMLVDEVDRRLTAGLLKKRYPYNSDDDDNPDVPGADDLLKNPRELIIDMIGVYGNPESSSTPDSVKTLKVADVIYLLSSSPEFQVKK